MLSRTKKQEHPIVAVDAVILTVIKNKLNVLLIKIKYGSFVGSWGVPGGRVRINETLDEAAKRELYEKTGVKNVYLEQLYSFGGLKRDPKTRIVSAAYFALIDSNKVKLKATGKYENIGWFPVHKLGKLAYDHNEIIEYALFRLRNKIKYTNIIYSLLPEKFTLTTLQKFYEITLEKKLDKRNFRKKILSSNLIKEVDIEAGVSHRPSKLYSFKNKKPMFIEMF
jgi:8-oxo-dGTP diphosphatase